MTLTVRLPSCFTGSGSTKLVNLVRMIATESKADKLVVSCTIISVTRLGDFLDFGQLFQAFGNN